MALSQFDEEQLVSVLNQLGEKIPSFLKGSINMMTISSYLTMIPDSFKNYTLRDLIDAINRSVEKGKIKI